MHTLCDKQNLRGLTVGLRAAVKVECVKGIWHLRDIVVAKPDVRWVSCKAKVQFLAPDGAILTSGKDVDLFVTSETCDPWHMVIERELGW